MTDDSPIETTYKVRALHALACFYGKAYQRVEVKRPCPIPATGPALVAANHTAGLDPIAIQTTCPRPIFWVMTRDYYDRPSLKWLFEWTEMIPIDREGKDAGAWRAAMRQLKAGRVVGVFPEGRIERQRKLMPFQPGIGLLAARVGADVYPVYLDGLQRNQSMLRAFLQPQHPSVAWGEPIRLAKAAGRSAFAHAARRLETTMEQLSQDCPARRRRGRPLLD